MSMGKFSTGVANKTKVYFTCLFEQNVKITVLELLINFTIANFVVYKAKGIYSGKI